MPFDAVQILVGHFFDPAHRLFLPTVAASLLMVTVVCALSYRHNFKNLKNGFFSKKVWSHPSSRLDIQIFLFNNFFRFLALSLFSGLLISSYELSLKALSFLNLFFGSEFQGLSQNSFVQKLSFTALSFTLLDFFRFIQHYCMHKVPFLWRYHRVHHSAEVLTPLTLTRIHPIEMFIGLFRSTLAVSLSTALFIYLFRVPVHGLEIVGVNLFGFAFNVLGSNIRHSHFWLSFGSLEHIFMSPAQHQIHHSSLLKHRDKNFGIAFSFWDKLFGSFVATQASPPKNLPMGVENFKATNLWRMIKP